MKRMMTICAIALATTFSTWAQSDMQDPNRNQGEKRQNRSERPRAALDLDEKQSKEFKKINTDFTTEAKKIKKEYSDDKASMRSKIKKLETTRDDKVKKLLTKEQYEKYTQMVEKRKEKGKGENREGKGKRGGGKGGKRQK
jgi:Spy/CpxP family protein refolding chaperone